MEYILEYISVHNPFTPTKLGIPNPFPRGYGNGLFLYSEDGSTQYRVENLSYEDLVDAIELGIIDSNLQVKSTIICAPQIRWGYEPIFETYKSVIVVDPRLPDECFY